MLRTFLFDLDGTLIDSVPLILASLRHSLGMHLSTPPPDEVCLQGVGTPLKAQLARFTDDPQVVEAMYAAYRAHNERHHDHLLREFPGVRDALLDLRARGGRLGIVTSKMRATAARGLARCHLDDLFEVVVALEDSTGYKPDPEPVLEALRRLDAPAETAVYVGDSPFDMEAGRRAGVRTAAALWGPFSRERLAPWRPDWWLSLPSEIRSLG